MPDAPNAVRELAEDETSRKKFLRQAGGGGVAASLAVFIAACGGNDSSTSSSKPAATATPTAMASGGTEQFGKGDLGIANYALTLEYIEADFYAKVANSGMLKGKLLDTARRFGNEEQAHVDALIALIKKAGGKPASQAGDDVPARRREVDPEARRDRREPRRQRLPRAGGQHPGQGDPGCRAVDPLGRGAPRGGPQPRHGRQAGQGSVRHGRERRRGPQGRQALPRHLARKD